MKFKNKRRNRKRVNIIGTIAVLLVVMTIIGIVMYISPAIKDLFVKQKSPYPFLLDINRNVQADISNYHTYGTHFNLDGTLQLDLISKVEDVKFVFRNDLGEEKEYSLNYEIKDSIVSFDTSEKINTGINLEELPVGNYYALIKVIYAKDENTKVVSEKKKDEDKYDNIKYYSLLDKSDDLAISYYTITKNNTNNIVDIAFENLQMVEFVLPSMTIKSKECELPDDVYDIVIDPGHGGLDGGTVNGEYTESKIVLDISLKLKDKLEELGLKVKLTRDGTEDSAKPMAYTMYDEDGRVNVAGDSKAKLCISLHLNSFDGKISNGGLQVYCPYNIDSKFASTLADDIIKNANTYASTMEAHSIGKGIYCRTFDENDINSNVASAKGNGYEPYKLDTTINYYYIIRELGGKITGAYVDGRNEKYGTNKYFDSNVGVETYLLELGYISHDADLNNLVKNQDGYVNGIVDAIRKQFNLVQ